jgi:hypothetical protein
MTTDTDPARDIGAACQNLLGMFVAVCGAPDDLDVAAEANRALRHLDDLLTGN